MSERKGLLLVGSEEQTPYLHELDRKFQAMGVETTHRRNVAHRLALETRQLVELEYYRTGDRDRDHGERLLQEYLGQAALRSAGLLIVNIEPGGDMPEGQQRGDISLKEWTQVLAHRGNPEAQFALHPIPSRSVYAHFTHGINGLPSPRVVGGRLEVVRNKIFEIEGRRVRK